MAGKEFKLIREPDALYEVTYILDAALGPGEGREPHSSGIEFAAGHYERRFGLSRAVCEKWFTPLREIERHVTDGLALSEEVLRRDYRAPNEALSPPSALVRHAMRYDLSVEKLAALIYNEAASIAPGDEGNRDELSLEEFVRLMSGLDEHEAPLYHRWNMLDLCVNWEQRFAEISSVLRRGEELYMEKVSLAEPLIGEWYGRTKEALDDGGLDALFDGFDWLHLSGITPALNQNCADFILRCLRTAKEKGLTVSFDGNFRSQLWSWEAARDYCTLCLPYVDVLFGIEPYHLWKDESDHSKGDWKDGVPLQPSYEEQDEIFHRFIERYPNLKCIGRHVRYVHSGSENSLKAFMWYEGHTFESRLYTFNVLDRVGGGDAFASGLIYAMMHGYRPMDMINFAVASSVIKHTIHGDANITDDVESIRNLMNMNYDIKR